MNLTHALLTATLDEIERDPALRERLRRVLGVDGAAVSTVAETGAQFEPVAAFARRISMSERHTWQLVREGLPTVGDGRGRRVEIERALAWHRGRDQRVDDVVELDARRRARLAAQRKTRGS